MATILRCDGCDLTLDAHEARQWQSVRVSCEGVRNYFDLCPKCYKRGVLAIRAEQPKALSPAEVALLQQIWGNAQNFDQSIGEVVEPWHGKAGDGPHG